MGIIRAIKNTISGALSDQWLEVIRAENMAAIALCVWDRFLTVRAETKDMRT